MKSVKSSPNKPVNVDLQRRRSSRFDSTRNSITTQMTNVPEVKERVIKKRRNPMKSSLSSTLKNNLKKQKLGSGNFSLILIFIGLNMSL